METWFSRQARKAWQQQSYLKDPTAILGKAQTQRLKQQTAQFGGDDVQVVWLQAAYRGYCLRLAEQLTQSGQVSLKAPPKWEAKKSLRSPETTLSDWPTQLLGDTPDSVRLRQGCPLQESADHAWRFIHASLLDYFMTTAITEGLLLPSSDLPPSPYGFSQAQAVVLLAHAPLTRDQINFLVDRVKNHSALQQALFALIERSKGHPAIAIASANAATVLMPVKSTGCQHWARRNYRGLISVTAYSHILIYAALICVAPR